jgi:hypothetical protein
MSKMFVREYKEPCVANVTLFDIVYISSTYLLV